MTSFENPLENLRALKGAPVSVFLALMFAGRDKIGPVSNEWLERATGYSDKPVSQALAVLKDYHLVLQTSRGWTLANGAVQLPLMVEDSTDNNQEPLNSLDRTNPVANGEVSRRISESENLRLSSSSRSLNLDSRMDPLQPDSRAGESENLRLILAELDQHGIREPARSRLARLPGIQLELVKYHLETVPAGQAIYRIEHGWPIAKNWRPEKAESVEAADEPQEDDPAEISEDADTAWRQIREKLRDSMSRAEFNTWIEPLKPISLENEVLKIRACNHYGKDVASTWLKNLGDPAIQVEVIV